MTPDDLNRRRIAAEKIIRQWHYAGRPQLQAGEANQLAQAKREIAFLDWTETHDPLYRAAKAWHDFGEAVIPPWAWGLLERLRNMMGPPHH